MAKTIVYLILVLFMLGNSCSERKDLKVIAEKLRVKNSVPGMAVAIVKADTILEMFTLGFRRDGHPDTIQLDDRFHLGSNTKAMTSFIAGHLVEDEKIDWSTTLTDLYPTWRTKIDSQYWNVSLGALLSHRGRIQAFWTDIEFDSITIERQAKSVQRKEFNLYALNRAPITPDSNGFLYSNAGYSIAAQMLEKASDLTWEELMEKTFNDDLNLNIGFSWPNKTDVNQPWGHSTDNGQLTPVPPDDDFDLDWLEPGGDVNIALPDYCKFIQLNLQGLLGNDNYLQTETYDLLHTDGRNSLYAYGWGNENVDNRSFSFHTGSAGTFLAHTVIEKSESIAYIIMLNTNSPGALDMTIKLRKKMEDLYSDFAKAKGGNNQ